MDSNFSASWARHGEDLGEDVDTVAQADDTSWGNLTEDFSSITRDQKRKAISEFNIMEKISKIDDNAKSLFDEIVKSLFRYISTIDNLSKRKIDIKEGLAAAEEREGSDRARTNSHEALISCLNAYSRYCRKIGVDNSWRGVLGLERTDVTRWALAVAEHAQSVVLKR